MMLLTVLLGVLRGSACMYISPVAAHDNQTDVSSTPLHGQPPIQCPPNCAYNAKDKCCGVNQKYGGSQQCYCPKAVLFATGFDSDMVLQREPSISAVYGSLIGSGDGAKVEITVTDTADGSNYTVPAVITPAPTYCYTVPGPTVCYANYSRSWKAFLKPAAAGGDYTITASCLENCGTEGGERDVTTIERVTMGDVYFCSGQSNMALPSVHDFSSKDLRNKILGGSYKGLRFYQFEHMDGGKIGAGGSYTPLWVRQKGAQLYQPPNSSRIMTWFNASFAAGISVSDSCADEELCGQEPLDPFAGFSATCFEFGRSLLDEIGDSAPPIGLIQSAIGGTTIEAWSPNSTTLLCQNKSAGSPTAGRPNGQLFYGMVCPFINMTVAGFIWYQGENNMHGDPGSSAAQEGYGCMMPHMVSTWRSLWSVVPNTTPSNAPFGLVTIAPSGSEGASYHLSMFRWAQTANYGVLPNQLMENTFLAQAYDLNEPWENVWPEHSEQVCSSNKSIRFSCTWPGPPDSYWGGPSPCCHCGDPKLASPKCVWNVSLWNRDLAPIAPEVHNSSATPTLMGSLHPRLKAPVGRRLAAALSALKYEGNGTVTGPTISGCEYYPTNHSLIIQFNRSLLRGDTVTITRGQQQNAVPPVTDDSSFMQVCTGSMVDCNCLVWYQPKQKKGASANWTCEVPFEGGLPRPPQAVRGDIWAEVPVSVIGSSAVAVDASGLNTSTGAIQALKFAWSYEAGTCCIDQLSRDGLSPCIPGSCGLMTKESLMPANPFFAKISAQNKCVCPTPQTCNE